MPLATRERIWAELPPLEEEPEVTVEKKEERETVDGKEVVTVTEVRTTTVRKLKCVEERKKWPLFGLKPDEVAANDSMSDREETSWELPVTVKSTAPVSAADKKEYEDVKCRHCGGAHFSYQCPKRRIQEATAVSTQPEAAAPADDEKADSAAAGGKYVLPSMLRRGLGASGTDRPERVEYTLRVSNLTEDATEDDVRDLFGRFGRVTRCFVKMAPNGRYNMGFAFVSFDNEKDARRACEKLNGFGYGHLILSVEPKQPNK